MPKTSNTNTQIEQSDVTMQDLYSKLSKSVDAKMDKYMYISMIFPETHKLWAYHWSRESELDFVEFSYQVGEDDSVTVGEPLPVKLSMTYASESTNPNVNIQVNLDDTAKLLSEKEIKISTLETKVSELEIKVTELSTESETKTDALVKASEEITNLSAQVELLTPFKVKADEIAEIENQKVLSEKKEALKKYAIKGGYILEAELTENVEISTAIESLDESFIKGLIADRFMKRLDEAEVVEPTVTPTVEASTTPDPIVTSATANINLDDDESFDPISTMTSFLKSK